MKHTAARIRKGDFHYIVRQRKATLLRSVLLFILSFSIFLFGYFYSGRSVRNLFTIIAVLGFLPTAKSMVNTIMFYKAKGCSEALRDKILENGERLHHYFDFYFTSYQKNYPVSHMVLQDHVLLGVTEQSGCDCRACEQHLMSHLKQEGLHEITVTIYDHPEHYCERLSELAHMHDSQGDTLPTEREESVFQLMKAISL